MRRHVTFAAALLGIAMTVPIVRAQDTPAPQTSVTTAPSGVDEIVVTRQRLSSMRRELEKAQEDLYKLFNANTSDHELDMHCHQEMPTGSRVSRRVCRPQFVDNATAQGAWDLTSYMYSHCDSECPVASVALEMGASAAQEPFNKLRYMAKRLDDEMVRLARENPEVAKALGNYQGKERAYHEALSGQAKK
jgi:hypothetical protein